MWILRSVDPAPAVTLRLPPGSEKTIGRGAAAGFSIDTPLLSRFHCNLTASAEELVVEDLDSTNGTFVNGQRVQRTRLREGDLLRLGGVELSVVRE